MVDELMWGILNKKGLLTTKNYLSRNQENHSKKQIFRVSYNLGSAQVGASVLRYSIWLQSFVHLEDVVMTKLSPSVFEVNNAGIGPEDPVTEFLDSPPDAEVRLFRCSMVVTFLSWKFCRNVWHLSMSMFPAM